MFSNFKTIADRLGLTYEAGNGIFSLPRVHGLIDGQPVRCTWTDRGTSVEGLVDPPLDLGVRVRMKNITVSLSLGNRVLLGDPSWDDEVDATADEPERAAALFNQDVRGALLRLNSEGISLEMRDDKVSVAALQYDDEAAVRAVSQVSRLARLIHEARPSVPHAGPVAAHAAALEAFAAANGLGVARTPFRLTGTLRQVKVSAMFARTGAGHFTAALGAASIAAPHGFGLVVRPETTTDRLRTFFGGQDLKTGDPTFDPAFLVRAIEEDRAMGALDADVRALLLDLRGRFETVTLQDATLALAGPASRLQPADMPAILEMAATIVERVERASAAIPRGPYR